MNITIEIKNKVSLNSRLDTPEGMLEKDKNEVLSRGSSWAAEPDVGSECWQKKLTGKLGKEGRPGRKAKQRCGFRWVEPELHPSGLLHLE